MGPVPFPQSGNSPRGPFKQAAPVQPCGKLTPRPAGIRFLKNSDPLPSVPSLACLPLFAARFHPLQEVPIHLHAIAGVPEASLDGHTAALEKRHTEYCISGRPMPITQQ